MGAERYGSCVMAPRQKSRTWKEKEKEMKEEERDLTYTYILYALTPHPRESERIPRLPPSAPLLLFFPFYFFLFKINILASIFIIIFFLSFPSILAFLITTLTHSYIARAPAQPTTTTTATTGSRSIPRILSPPPLRYLFFRFFLFLRTRWPIFHTHLTDPNSQTTMKFSSFFFIRRR